MNRIGRWITAAAVMVTAVAAADGLLERHLAAARSRVPETRVSEGWIETPQGRAGMTVWQKAPGRVVAEMRLPRGTIRRGYNGTRGWESSSLSGYRPMSEAAALQFAAEWALGSRSAEAIRAKFPKQEPVSGAVLQMIPANGTPETWAFDPETHLLVKIERTVNGGPQGMIPVVVSLEDYREVSGAMEPHVLRTRTGPNETAVRFDSIRDGVELNDAMFEPPELP